MTKAKRIRELEQMAEFGGMDVLYDYVIALERENERLRRAASKRARPAPEREGETKR